MKQLVPQELQAIKSGQFDAIMQKTAADRHESRDDYLAPKNVFS